jgi:hypothetical protein
MERVGHHRISEPDFSTAGTPVQSDLSAPAKNGSSLEGALEHHYSAKEIAGLWGLCENSVRELFKNEPGVVRIQRPKSRWKRAYTTLRIPKSVLERVHRRMSFVT